VEKKRNLHVREVYSTRMKAPMWGPFRIICRAGRNVIKVCPGNIHVRRE